MTLQPLARVRPLRYGGCLRRTTQQTRRLLSARATTEATPSSGSRSAPVAMRRSRRSKQRSRSARRMAWLHGSSAVRITFQMPRRSPRRSERRLRRPRHVRRGGMRVHARPHGPGSRGERRDAGVPESFRARRRGAAARAIVAKPESLPPPRKSFKPTKSTKMFANPMFDAEVGTAPAEASPSRHFFDAKQPHAHSNHADDNGEPSPRPRRSPSASMQERISAFEIGGITP